ncbi:MAG TPA: hypothetical protein VMQ83_10400 [Gammaproteobacteria bacterium]|nr:hypothetical protein [Gammaproteobacteria bacterium]
MRLIAFILERAVIVSILDHLGEPSEPPRAAPIRDPPEVAAWRRMQMAESDVLVLDPAPQLMPDYENQRQDMG